MGKDAGGDDVREKASRGIAALKNGIKFAAKAAALCLAPGTLAGFVGLAASSLIRGILRSAGLDAEYQPWALYFLLGAGIGFLVTGAGLIVIAVLRRRK